MEGDESWHPTLLNAAFYTCQQLSLLVCTVMVQRCLFFSPPGRVGLVRAVYLFLVQPYRLPDGTAW